MEGRLAKNQYPTSVDFKFNINSTRSPKLKDHWSRIIRRCKSELTTTLIDVQAYSRTKASIAKDLTELDTLLTKEQFQEIKDSLLDKFQQMAPFQIDKTRNLQTSSLGNASTRLKEEGRTRLRTKEGKGMIQKWTNSLVLLKHSLNKGIIDYRSTHTF